MIAAKPLDLLVGVNAIVRNMGLLTILLLGTIQQVWAGDLLFDQGKQINGLWVFPLLSNVNHYKYVPSKAQLVINENGDPAFSMTFYVKDTPSSGAGDGGSGSSSKTIVNAEGGALLHFLMEYNTDRELITNAEVELRDELDNDEISITGPIVFDSGQYSIISSVLNDDEVRASSLLAQQAAPLLEGNRIAISANLPPDLATLFLASLQTETADLSITYDMKMSGLSKAYQATMVIDWNKVSKSMGGGAGGSIYFVSVDVEAQVDRLFQDGSITLDVNGDDEDMESLLQTAYNKAIDIMYSPIEIDDVPEQQQGGLMDAISGLINSKDGALSSRNTTGFGAYTSFRLKDIRSEGHTRLSFNKRASVDRSAILTANVGGLFNQFGDDEKFIQFVSTHDAAFDLRKIFVQVDGMLVKHIGEFVNSIELTLNKAHPSGRHTTRQLLLSNHSLLTQKTIEPLTYNNLEQEDSDQWLKYTYNTRWSFKGGGEYVSPVVETNAAMINLIPPYRGQTIQLEGDGTLLKTMGVKAVVVDVRYDFFGQSKSVRRTIRPVDGSLVIEPIQLTLPAGVYDYEYQISWLIPETENRTLVAKDQLGFIFIDEIPPLSDVGSGG